MSERPIPKSLVWFLFGVFVVSIAMIIGLLYALAASAQLRELPTGFVAVDYGRYQWLPGDWYECTAKKCDMANETFSMTPMYVLCQRSWGGPGFTPWETEFRAFRDERACHDAEWEMNKGFNGLNGVEEHMYCVYDPHWRRR